MVFYPINICELKQSKVKQLPYDEVSRLALTFLLKLAIVMLKHRAYESVRIVDLGKLCVFTFYLINICENNHVIYFLPL